MRPAVYKFTGKDGRTLRFKLDPSGVVNQTLRSFEGIVSNLPNGDKVEAQFIPTFKALRREMLKFGWNRDEVGPHATLLTIQQLCNKWGIGKI